jgi:hypothetical protein
MAVESPEQLATAFAAAVTRGDAEQAAALFTENGVFVGPEGIETRGRPRSRRRSSSWRPPG